MDCTNGDRMHIQPAKIKQYIIIRINYDYLTLAILKNGEIILEKRGNIYIFNIVVRTLISEFKEPNQMAN